MNWYKKANINFSTWLSNQTQDDNNRKLINQNTLQTLIDWIAETQPNLEKYTLDQAIKEAQYDQSNKIKDQYHPETIKRTHNKAIFNSQNINPHTQDFMVDTRKEQGIPKLMKDKAYNEIHALGDYHKEIPIGKMFEILEKYGIIPIQEDGTYWSGFLMGNKPCGHPEADKQRLAIQLAFKKDGAYIASTNYLIINWCVMEHSGKYEVIKYIS